MRFEEALAIIRWDSKKGMASKCWSTDYLFFQEKDLTYWNGTVKRASTREVLTSYIYEDWKIVDRTDNQDDIAKQVASILKKVPFASVCVQTVIEALETGNLEQIERWVK